MARPFNKIYAGGEDMFSDRNMYGTENTKSTYMPATVDYNLPQAIGLSKRVKKAVFYPTGISSIELGPNDTFRFRIKSQDFWDPYSAHLSFTVNIPTTLLEDDPGVFNALDLEGSKVRKMKCLQVDGTAQSFIETFVVKSGSTGDDLERIEGYDIVASFLADLCTCNPGGMRTTDYAGNGGAIGSNFTNQTFTRAAVPTVVVTSGGTNVARNPPENFNGNDNRIIPTLFYDPTRDYNYSPDVRLTHPTNSAEEGWVKTLALDVNSAEYNENKWENNRLTKAKFWPGINATKKTPFPAPVAHVLYDCPMMGFESIYGDGYINENARINIGGDEIKAGNRFIKPFNKTKQPNRALTNNIYDIDTEDVTKNHDIGTFGFSNPFPANFSKTCFEPIFTLAPQKVIYNGVPSSRPITQMNFVIPLLSGFLGHLMQPNNYKLIPLVAFGDGLTLEFKLNPYALFSSFSSTAYQDRRYYISDMELQADLIEFTNLAVIEATNNALATGFSLCSQSYFQGPMYTYAENNLPRSLQINLGFDSMRAVLLVLLADDYKNNTMYRKQYRLSGNITALQLKIGTEFFPQQRIKGNGGCNYGTENNYEFFINLLKCFGKVNSKEEIGINVHNFAINWRELAVAEKVGKLLFNKAIPGAVDTIDPNTGERVRDAIGYTTYQNYASSVMNGVQLGMFYENRIIGKAVYGISCTPSNYENYILEGKNTITTRPFDLLITNQNNSANYGYINSATAYVYIYYDAVWTFVNGTVRSLGRT